MFAFSLITIIILICFGYLLIFELEKVILPFLQPLASQIIIENVSKTGYVRIKFLSPSMSEDILVVSLAGYRM